MRRIKLMAALVAAGTLLLAACGGDDDDTSSGSKTESSSKESTTTTAESTDAAMVKSESSSLGDILVTADGKTVYAFTNDKDGKPTCGAGCSDTWPAVSVPSDQLPAGLDASVFTVVAGVDGGFQLAAAKHPLYTFSGDSASGDTKGQALGNVWFVVNPDGSLNMGTGSTDDVTTSTADDGY